MINKQFSLYLTGLFICLTLRTDLAHSATPLDFFLKERIDCSAEREENEDRAEKIDLLRNASIEIANFCEANINNIHKYADDDGVANSDLLAIRDVLRKENRASIYSELAAWIRRDDWKITNPKMLTVANRNVVVEIEKNSALKKEILDLEAIFYHQALKQGRRENNHVNFENYLIILDIAEAFDFLPSQVLKKKKREVLESLLASARETNPPNLETMRDLLYGRNFSAILRQKDLMDPCCDSVAKKFNIDLLEIIMPTDINIIMNFQNSEAGNEDTLSLIDALLKKALPLNPANIVAVIKKCYRRDSNCHSRIAFEVLPQDVYANDNNIHRTIIQLMSEVNNPQTKSLIEMLSEASIVTPAILDFISLQTGSAESVASFYDELKNGRSSNLFRAIKRSTEAQIALIKNTEIPDIDRYDLFASILKKRNAQKTYSKYIMDLIYALLNDPNTPDDMIVLINEEQYDEKNPLLDPKIYAANIAILQKKLSAATPLSGDDERMIVNTVATIFYYLDKKNIIQYPAVLANILSNQNITMDNRIHLMTHQYGNFLTEARKKNPVFSSLVKAVQDFEKEYQASLLKEEEAKSKKSDEIRDHLRQLMEEPSVQHIRILHLYSNYSGAAFQSNKKMIVDFLVKSITHKSEPIRMAAVEAVERIGLQNITQDPQMQATLKKQIDCASSLNSILGNIVNSLSAGFLFDDSKCREILGLK